MRRFFARLTIWIALVLSALFTALIALGYFILALYLWLAEYLVPPVAALLSGILLLMAASVFALIASTMFGGLAGRDRGRDRDSPPLGLAETAADIGSLFGDKVQGFASMNKGTSMLTALVAGFAIGLSPKLRSLLWRLLKKLT
jgi:hypothetical protein